MFNISTISYHNWFREMYDYTEESVHIYRRITAMNLKYFPDNALSVKCVPVTDFNTESLKDKLAEMRNIMSYHNGVGIAANQCGYVDAMILVKDNKGTVHEFINPKVTATDGSINMSEGCLSSPLIFINVTRAESLTLSYQDVTGEHHQIMAEGKEARIILHEMEHLSGVSYLSHVNRNQRKALLSQLKKYLKKTIA